MMLLPKLGATNTQGTCLLSRNAVLAAFGFGIAVRGTITNTALGRGVTTESRDLLPVS